MIIGKEEIIRINVRLDDGSIIAVIDDNGQQVMQGLTIEKIVNVVSSDEIRKSAKITRIHEEYIG